MLHALAAAILALVQLPSGFYPDHFGAFPATRAREIAAFNVEAARQHGLDPWLLTALEEHESNFDPAAVSVAGAFGMTQVMPALWGKDALHRCLSAPSECLRSQVLAGAEALAWARRRCGPDAKAVTAYRFGHCAVPRDRDHAVIRTRNALRAKWGAP